MSQLQPKIYVACLSAYSSGRLYGKWIDANQDVASLERAIQKMLAKSPIKDAEEWAIHAQEDFGDVILSESEDLENVSEIAAFIAKKGELGAALFDHFYHVKDAKRAIEEAYYGIYESEKEFAYEYFNETIREYFEEIILKDDSKSISIFNELMVYIDYESYARNCFISDFFSVKAEDAIHIFRNL